MANNYVKFAKQSSHRKTGVWNVESIKAPLVLGKIGYAPLWRKFCFYPNLDTMYDTNCLLEIALFCEEQTTEWKKKNKKEK